MTVNSALFFAVAAVLVVSALAVVAAIRPLVSVAALLALFTGVVAVDLLVAAPLLALLMAAGVLAPAAALAVWAFRRREPLLDDPGGWLPVRPVALAAGLGFCLLATVAVAGAPTWYGGGAQATFGSVIRHRATPIAAGLAVMVLVAVWLGAVLARVDADEAHHQRLVAERRARQQREERRRADRARARSRPAGEGGG